MAAFNAAYKSTQLQGPYGDVQKLTSSCGLYKDPLLVSLIDEGQFYFWEFLIKIWPTYNPLNRDLNLRVKQLNSLTCLMKVLKIFKYYMCVCVLNIFVVMNVQLRPVL